MNISGKTADIINDINNISDRFLKNNYDISILIEISFFSDKLDLFRNLIFVSKYVCGLKNILSSPNVSGKDFIDKTYSDFNSNLQKVFHNLKLILENEDQIVVDSFEMKYFKMDQVSLNHMMELTEDLALCKEYMNKTVGIFDN